MRPYILVLLLLIPIGLPAASLAGSDTAVPDDFKIELYSFPRSPDSPAPSLKLVINADGHYSYYERPGRREAPVFVLISEGNLDTEAMEKIYETIKKERFFDLKEEYRDPQIMDGDLAQMEIAAEGKKHNVVTVNIRVDAFDNIVREINRHVSYEAYFYYNALREDLTGDLYKRVER